MKQAAMTDRLTGFASQMMLDRKLSEINLYRKYPYTAAVCTISGLQFISDGFGESAHDMAVIRLSETIRKRIRTEDFAAAEGDMIVLLLPEAGADDADRIFEQVNSVLGEERVLPFPLSAEYGSASRPDPDAPMQETVERARSTMIRRKMLHISEVNEQLVKSLRKTLAETGRETAAHTANIKMLCEKLGKALRLDSTQMKNLALLAEFHDIGKQPISSDILAKGNSLTGKELELKKLHAVNGSCLAHSVPELESIADDILCHHERWDGTGYPNGFAGERIPYLARILSVADAFDAMTHDHSGYRAVPEQNALSELKRCSGTQFDPKIVKTFISLFGN
jgi:HD-GYP domain-containing protein (c-di-GMP phosphodiesterase class II)